MSKTYQIKTNAAKGDSPLIDVAPAPGKAPASIQAVSGARYELIDSATQAAPDNIRIMRKGKNLQIFFDGSTEAGAVVENFYEAHVDEQPTLVGRTEVGKLFEYIPESAAPSSTVSQLDETGNTYGMALGGVELAATSGASAAVAALPVLAGFSPLLIGAGALGVAAAAGGGGGGDSPAPLATAKLADASDSGTKGDNKTSDSTPTLSGTAPVGSSVTVTVNGKTYPVTVNADGTHSYTIPDTDKLPDGTYTPIIKLTQNGTTTSYNGTPFTIDTVTNIKITDSGLAGSTKAISGTSEAGDTIEVTDVTGKLIGTTTADSSGKWSLTPTQSLAAGNITAKATDIAGNTATDTGLNLINGGKALGITIDMDANDDGFVNFEEKGTASSTTLTATFDKTKVSVGDVITFSDGTSKQIVTLTTADVAAGMAKTSWLLPVTEGSLLKVIATITDATQTANNVSPQASDSATVDAVAPSNAGMITKMSIMMDVNDDGWINSTELGTASTFVSRATLSNTAKAGEKIVFSASNDGAALPEQTVMLSSADVINGYVEVSFAKPSDGGKQSVNAKFIDTAGNPATDAVRSDQAILDTIPTSNTAVGLKLKITTDLNDNEWVSNSEFGNADSFTARATFTGSKVTEGEFIVFNASNGNASLTPISYKLTATDIARGQVEVSFPKPSEGQFQTVTAQYMDKAGNKATDTETDQARLDTRIPQDVKLSIDLDKDNNGYINNSEKSVATNLTADFLAFKDSVSEGDILTFKIGSVTKDVTIDAKMLGDGKYTLSGWDQAILPAELSAMVAEVMFKDAAGNGTGWFKDTAILDFTGLKFTAQKPTLDVTTSPTELTKIEFGHDTKEDGHFTLWVGSFKYTGQIVDGKTQYDAPPAGFTSRIDVTGHQVYLDFTDLAGNTTTSTYDLGNIKQTVDPAKFSFIV